MIACHMNFQPEGAHNLFSFFRILYQEGIPGVFI